MIATKANAELDARGLNCPLPILRARKALATLQSGETLRVISTDLGSVKDISSFCNQAGHDLLDSKQDNGEYTYIIRKV